MGSIPSGPQSSLACSQSSWASPTYPLRNQALCTFPKQSSVLSWTVSGKFFTASKFAVIEWLRTLLFEIFCFPIEVKSFIVVLFNISSLKFLRCGQTFRKFSKSLLLQMSPSGYLGILDLDFFLLFGRVISSSSSFSQMSSSVSESEADSSDSSLLLSRTLTRFLAWLFPRPAQRVFYQEFWNFLENPAIFRIRVPDIFWERGSFPSA